MSQAQEIELTEYILMLDEQASDKGGRVISLLGNHHQLETLQNILTTKPPFHYVIWVDESDTFSKDFDYQPVDGMKSDMIH